MNFIYTKITEIFDPLQHLWEHDSLHRKISSLLIFLFVLGVFLIELQRRSLLPEFFAFIPSNHFYAVQAAFTVVLILEIVSLILTLPCSVSKAVGKQFEIFSLILMRNAFKELSYMEEPIVFAGNEGIFLKILSDGFGALLIFFLLGVYYIIQRKNPDEKMAPLDLFAFISIKKGISLILLAFFVYMGLQSAWLTINGIPHSDFFHDFYTLLVLSDILLVLCSQRFQPSFYAMFRNSGYALSTLLIRIALVAPTYYDVGLGVTAVVFAILLTAATNYIFARHNLKTKYTRT